MAEPDLSQDDFGEELAEAFRDDHRVAAPVIDLVAVAGIAFNADVTVMELPEVLDGITFRDADTGATLIAIAASDNPERQRFSLAHEIGHLAAGHLNSHSAHGLDLPLSVPELQAHGFARHLLLPRKELTEFVDERAKGKVDARTMSDIVDYFRVSGTVAAIQLKRLGYIDDSTARKWANMEASDLAIRYGWAEEWALRQQEARTTRPPQRMAANATDAYEQHLLPIETVASIEQVEVGELRERFEKADIRPLTQDTGLSLDDL